MKKPGPQTGPGGHRMAGFPGCRYRRARPGCWEAGSAAGAMPGREGRPAWRPHARTHAGSPSARHSEARAGHGSTPPRSRAASSAGERFPAGGSGPSCGETKALQTQAESGQARESEPARCWRTIRALTDRWVITMSGSDQGKAGALCGKWMPRNCCACRATPRLA
jgi:hypothetical protein